jgi:osmotically-inducible protein OsmY
VAGGILFAGIIRPSRARRQRKEPVMIMISRTAVLAGTLLVSGAWFAGSHTRALADDRKDHVDDQARKEKDRIDDQAKAEKARVDDRADEKKAAIDRSKEPAVANDRRTRDRDSKASKDTVGDEVTDAWITTKVKASFSNDKALKGSDIHVDTDHKGVVVLSGYVPSDGARAHAVSVARDTKGVHEVKDELRLKTGH